MADMGRPSKFNEQVKNTILKLYEDGKTDEQVADIIGISVRTLYNWKAQKDDFFHAIKENKEVADQIVEASLFQRANGYTCKEVKLFFYRGKVIEKVINKHYPPDPTSMIFWLKNRKPEEWRDKQEIKQETDISGSVEVNSKDIQDRINQLEED